MILEAILGERRSRIQSGHPRDPALATLLGWGSKTLAGEVITEDSSLTISAFFRGVTLISDTVGITPLALYRRLAGEQGREPATGHPLYKLLHRRPNPRETAFAFRKWMQSNVILWGNGYAEIERNGAGRPLALWPIHPSRVRVTRETSGELLYHVRNERGGETKLDELHMLHIRNFSKDGVTGCSVVQLWRESLGLTMAAESYGAKFFGNNAQPQLVLKHPATFKNRDTAEAMRKQWREIYGGENVGGVAVLEEGMEVAKLGMPNDDAQFLQTREFQVEEVARWLGLPPHKLMQLRRATFSNIEHQAIETVTDCYLPWFVQWEQECGLKLLSEKEQETYYAEFNLNGLMRGDAQSRGAYYQQMTQMGAMSVDEVRRRENENPLPGGAGTRHFVQVNMMPLEQDEPAPNDEPAPESKTPLLNSSATPDGVDKVQDIGLNGAQITALQGLLQAVTDGTASPEATETLIVLAFPSLASEKVKSMISAAVAFEPEKAPESAPEDAPEPPPSSPAGPGAEPPAGDPDTRTLPQRSVLAELLAEAWGRQVRHDLRALGKAARKIGRLNPAGVDVLLGGLDGRLAAKVRSHMEPAQRAAFGACGVPDADVEARVSHAAQRYVQGLRGQLAGLLHATAEAERGAALTARLEEWELSLAGELAARDLTGGP